MQRTPEDSLLYDGIKNDAIDKIDDQFRFLPITSHISAFYLLGNNGTDIRNGIDSYLVDPAFFQEESWYQKEVRQTSELVWGELTSKYVSSQNQRSVIPVYRNFIDIHSGKVLGDIVMLFNPTFLLETYSTLLTDDDAIYIFDGEGNIIFSDILDGSSSFHTSAALADAVGNNSFLEITNSGNNYLITKKNSERTGLSVVLITRLDELQRQRKIIFNTTLLLVGGTVFLCWWFSLFLSEHFGRPIRLLTERINRIAHGDFDAPLTLPYQDELGDLGASIETMSSQIQRLIKESLQAQQEIKEAEIKLLQSQINPHFLHNTLNSIKWTAALQGAHGICDMVTSLGRLLRAIMGDVNEKIPIEEELALLEDYVHIQRIRYRGKLNYEKQIASDRILQYLIPKFTLQPLVENAIFHGIGPKDGSGKIVLSIEEDDQDLEIAVWDNGVGINQSLLNQLLIDTTDTEKHRIGLSNTERRIKLIYGSAYGLFIESKENQYTKVVLRIPAEKGGGDESTDS